MYYYQNTLQRITCVHVLVFQDQTPPILILKEYDNQPASICQKNKKEFIKSKNKRTDGY